MASVWIERRTTADGKAPHVVKVHARRCPRPQAVRRVVQDDARGDAPQAVGRGRVAAKRVPDPTMHDPKPVQAPTLRAATEQWRSSRIDVDDGTRTNDRVNTERVFKHDEKLATTSIDRLGPDRWAQVFADLAAVPYKRGTLKKSKEAFAMIFDHHAIDPNPLRDKRVKLPHEGASDIIVPLATHVEAVARALRPTTCSPT